MINRSDWVNFLLAIRNDLLYSDEEISELLEFYYEIRKQQEEELEGKK